MSVDMDVASCIRTNNSFSINLLHRCCATDGYRGLKGSIAIFKGDGEKVCAILQKEGRGERKEE